jgi:hypothetical protein
MQEQSRHVQGWSCEVTRCAIHFVFCGAMHCAMNSMPHSVASRWLILAVKTNTTLGMYDVQLKQGLE